MLVTSGFGIITNWGMDKLLTSTNNNKEAYANDNLTFDGTNFYLNGTFSFGNSGTSGTSGDAIFDTSLIPVGQTQSYTLPYPGGQLVTVGSSNVGNEYDLINVWPSIVVPNVDVNITSDIITYINHGYTTGDAVIYSAEGGLVIGGLVNGNTYYVRTVNTNTFLLFDTQPRAIAVPSLTGLRNLTSTGNNNQKFITGNVLTIDIDPTNSVVILDKMYNNVNLNFTPMNLDNNRCLRTLLIVESGAATDNFIVNANQVNGTVLTVYSSDINVNNNKVTVLEYSIVKNSSGIYKIYGWEQPHTAQNI